MTFLRSTLTVLMAITVVCNVVDAVKICAFNIQILGTTKMGKPEVVDILTEIITRYDMVLIQEIRDSSQTAIYELLDKVNDASGNQYSMSMGPRVGRSSSKEQYAYFYKSSKFWVKDSYTYNEPNDEFEREPYVVLFGSTSTSISEFSVIGLHSKPDDAVSEIDSLTDVYNNAVSRFGTSNSILMGDFNADCSYVGSSDWSNISLKSDSSFEWLISDSADTTVKSTNCAYDRIVLAGSGVKNNAGNGYVFNYQSYYGLSQSLAEDVSDHYPVYFNLY